jgi:hypothetical protein
LTFVAALAVQTAVTFTASACPVCGTDTGEQVQAGILDGNFKSTLFAVLLPFPILLGIVALIHFGWPLPARRTDQTLAQTEKINDGH